MALVLYDHPGSGNALKVRFLLAELGLGYETVEVPFDERPRPEWYRRVNPVGGIPTLVDGELVLAESNAILRYLAAREGRDDLYPTDLRARARRLAAGCMEHRRPAGDLPARAGRRPVGRARRRGGRAG